MHYGSLMQESDGELPGHIYCHSHKGCPCKIQPNAAQETDRAAAVCSGGSKVVFATGHWGLWTPWKKSLGRMFSPELCFLVFLLVFFESFGFLVFWVPSFSVKAFECRMLQDLVIVPLCWGLKYIFYLRLVSPKCSWLYIDLIWNWYQSLMDLKNTGMNLKLIWTRPEF